MIGLRLFNSLSFSWGTRLHKGGYDLFTIFFLWTRIPLDNWWGLLGLRELSKLPKNYFTYLISPWQAQLEIVLLPDLGYIPMKSYRMNPKYGNLSTVLNRSYLILNEHSSTDDVHASYPHKLGDLKAGDLSYYPPGTFLGPLFWGNCSWVVWIS